MAGSQGAAIICRLKVSSSAQHPSAYDTAEPEFASLPMQSSVEERGRELERPERQIAHSEVGVDGQLADRCTSICHWCLHSFDSRPTGMPIRKRVDGCIEVEGFYCSLECASAHAFDRYGSSCTSLSRHALCNELASSGSVANTVIPAPPREMLKLLGGCMTIDEFRNVTARIVLYPSPIVARSRHYEHARMPSSPAIAPSPRYVPIDNATIDSFTGLRVPIKGVDTTEPSDGMHFWSRRDVK